MAIVQKQSERRLAITLLAIVVLWGGGEGLRTLIHLRNGLAGEVVSLRDERSRAKQLLVESEIWKKRREWLNTNQPKLTDSRQESVALMDRIESGAKASGLEPISKGIGELERKESAALIPIKIQAKGEVRSLTKWLLQLQQPNSFTLVRKLTLKAAAQEGIVDCDLELVRCYSPEMVSQ